MVVAVAPQNTQVWETDAEFQDYMSAVDPQMPDIGIEVFPHTLYASGKSRVIPFDLSATLQTPYPCTSPNLLANFVRITAGDAIALDTAATSHMFYVIHGDGELTCDHGTIPWKAGDLLTVPTSQQLKHHADHDAALYWICDAPLLSYLGVAPTEARFQPVLYTKARLDAALQEARAQGGGNRTGILLSNPNFPQTLT